MYVKSGGDLVAGRHAVLILIDACDSTNFKKQQFQVKKFLLNPPVSKVLKGSGCLHIHA